MAKKTQVAGGVLAQRRNSTTAPDPLNTKRGPAISAATEKNTRDKLAQHTRELVDHTLTAQVVEAGHYSGRQGARGHDMLPSDASLQNGQYIPQACGKAGGSCDDDQRMADDYGTADEKDE